MGRARIQAIVAAFCLAAAGNAEADGQRDPGLRGVVAAAISSKPCFDGKYDDVVWYALMKPRVEQALASSRRTWSRDACPQIGAHLRAVHCESRKHGMLRDRRNSCSP